MQFLPVFQFWWWEDLIRSAKQTKKLDMNFWRRLFGYSFYYVRHWKNHLSVLAFIEYHNTIDMGFEKANICIVSTWEINMREVPLNIQINP